MRNIIKLVLVSLVVVAASSAVIIKMRRSAAAKASKDSLIVHEWGTFTSIAGKNGVALEWRPLNGASDLPKFVHTMQEGFAGLRHGSTKADLTALVRMETPVLYFYSPNETDVSVKVDFPKG